jgi:hypothetical protein
MFENIELAARCPLWLGNEYRDPRLEGSEGSLRDHVLEHGARKPAVWRRRVSGLVAKVAVKAHPTSKNK